MENGAENRKSEMILRLALAEQLEDDPEVLAFLPESELEERHVYSAGHERKMKKIFRMAKRAKRRPKRRKRMLRSAAGIAVLLGISLVTISSVDAFRIPVVSFIADAREKATQYRIAKKTEHPLTKSFAKFEPSYVPEGFYVESVKELKDSFSISYSNSETGLWYDLHYYSVPTTVSLDTEDSQVTETFINGNRTVIVEKNGQRRAAMYTGSSQINLYGTISETDLKHVLKSIK